LVHSIYSSPPPASGEHTTTNTYDTTYTLGDDNDWREDPTTDTVSSHMNDRNISSSQTY
jgi:hypothetical protein